MDDNAKDWIKTQFRASEMRRKRKIPGSKMELFVSPYDVPEAIRGYKRANSDKFVIELKYLLDDEEQKTVDYGSSVRFHVGKSSERVYAIEIDLDSELVERDSSFDVKLKWSEFSRAIDRLADELIESLHKENSELVKTAVRDNRSQLLAVH